jgi:hypothetical protein
MRKIVFAALAAASVSAVPASAAVIDFNGLHNNNTTSYTYVTGPYHEDGYTLNAALCQGSKKDGCFASVQGFKSIDKPGAALFTQYESQKVTITKDDGGLFTLSSLDFAEYWENGGYQPFSINVAFSWVLANGTLGSENRSFSTDGIYVPTTFTFNNGALKSFSFTPVGAVQFDNIVVNAAAAVPEPATWAMMIAGFGLVGGAMRRSSKSRPAFA